ncbi:hypothetical protein AVEN_2688-1 [Araneus ventricosus]|uniref:Uncharacterized protein n=1 Tax=Araneus ventricosus TaxID=182803 RepID=A0A4Y2NDF4_ARAVE|nr:hypothetical protein AVEN_2688-1 [Araneus ventricosus]
MDLERVKLPRKFLIAQEALDILWTLDDSHLDVIDNELVILNPDPDALSDAEDIDDSSTRKIENMCDDQYITHEEKNGTGLYLLILLKQPLLLHGSSISLVFSNDSLSLLDFRKHITVAYLGLSIPRNASCRKLGFHKLMKIF